MKLTYRLLVVLLSYNSRSNWLFRSVNAINKAMFFSLSFSAKALTFSALWVTFEQICSRIFAINFTLLFSSNTVSFYIKYGFSLNVFLPRFYADRQVNKGECIVFFALGECRFILHLGLLFLFWWFISISIGFYPDY